MIENREWLNFNWTRNYPFKTGLTRGSGANKLPTELLVDAKFAEVPRGETVFLANVKASGNNLTLTFNTSGASDSLQFVIPVSAHTAYKEYTATGNSMFGLIVVGDLSTLMERNLTGGISYGNSETQMEPNTYQYAVGSEVVTSLRSDGDNVLLNGAVVIKAGTGLRVVTEEGNNAIRIEFDGYSNTVDECDCPPNYPFIRTINGLRPDCDGNFCINAGGINVVEADGPSGGGCLKINTTFEPNQICLIETGIPGIQGSPGPQGATPIISICDCDSQIQSIILDQSSIASELDSKIGSVIAEVSTNTSQIGSVITTVSTNGSFILDLLSDTSTLSAGQSTITLSISDILADVSTNTSDISVVSSNLTAVSEVVSTVVLDCCP